MDVLSKAAGFVGNLVGAGKGEDAQGEDMTRLAVAQLRSMENAGSPDLAYGAAHDLTEALLAHEGLGSTEGVFRISASVIKSNQLRDRLLAGEVVDLTEIKDIHLLACTLKKCLQNTKEPVLDEHAIDGATTDGALKQLVGELATPNHRLLKRLSLISEKIVAGNGNTRMTDQAMAIVLAPNLGGSQERVQRMLELRQGLFTPATYTKPARLPGGASAATPPSPRTQQRVAAGIAAALKARQG